MLSRSFAEQAFAKEVMAAEGDDAEGEGEPEIEWSQDVFYTRTLKVIL